MALLPDPDASATSTTSGDGPASSAAEDVTQGRRDRRRQKTRLALYESALALFMERGFAATSVADIAAGADYSERSFFHHFARKEDVVFFDIPERLDALTEAFETRPANASAWTVIRTTLVGNLRRWRDTDLQHNHARMRLIHQEPALEARYLESCNEWEHAIAGIVAEDRRTDPDCDLVSRLVAAATVGAMRAALYTWAHDSSADPSSDLNTAFDLLEQDLRLAIAPAGRRTAPT